jgi:hypothetical protein
MEWATHAAEGGVVAGGGEDECEEQTDDDPDGEADECGQLSGE